MAPTIDAAEVDRISRLAEQAAKVAKQNHIVFWDQQTRAVDAVPDTDENRRSIPSRDVIHQILFA